MSSLRKVFLQFIFSGAYMKRWNDKLRPMEMFEIDKQAHKMIVAWLLFMINSRNMSPAEKLSLEQQVVEGGIFDYFYRLIITDIKPPVFYSIKENKQHYKELSLWVLEEIRPILSTLPGDAYQKFESWVMEKVKNEKTSLAERILAAAHLYASSWEFNIIKHLNSFDEEINEIDESFKKGQTSFSDLPGAKELFSEHSSKPSIARFAALCGQLRFQARWSQTPRIPETSVMGHMFMVAAYAYFFSQSINACPARVHNNFWGGLFHDLPELLTRDIISPVKASVESLTKLIHDYEEKELQKRVFAPLAEAGYDYIAKRLGYFLGLEVGSEFKATIVEEGKVQATDFATLQDKYNSNHFDPKDGELLKLCDNLAAFIEAYSAIRNGIRPPDLEDAMWRIKREKRDYQLGTIHFGALLADFD